MGIEKNGARLSHIYKLETKAMALENQYKQKYEILETYQGLPPVTKKKKFPSYPNIVKSRETEQNLFLGYGTGFLQDSKSKRSVGNTKFLLL
jgi:hypothetical protein